ncbi:MAG: hypothetical protein WB791_05010 [Waddliaceae bacterium]
MNQKEGKPRQNPTQLQDSWVQGSRWLINHRKTIAVLFVILFAVALIAYTLTTGKTTKAESNYLVAENSYTLLQSSLRGDPNPTVRIDTLDTLKTITNTYPELQAKYDGFIAQLLLIQDKVEEAAAFAERALNRTAKDRLPPYADFTRTTLLIAQGRHEEALKQANALKNLMIQQATTFPDDGTAKNFGDLLFAYNLFRIAMLNRLMGNAKQEKEAWEEWQSYAHAHNKKAAIINPEAFSQLSQQIGEGNFRLGDYIKEREQRLERS